MRRRIFQLLVSCQFLHGNSFILSIENEIAHLYRMYVHKMMALPGDGTLNTYYTLRAQKRNNTNAISRPSSAVSQLTKQITSFRVFKLI